MTVEQLTEFLTDYLAEAGALEAAYCHAAYRLGADWERDPFCPERWLALNHRLSALKPARESRAASAILGRRLLQLVAGLDPNPVVVQAVEIAAQRHVELHHCAAFGLMGSALGIAGESVVLAYLQQSITGLVSACQRLLPLGQQRAGLLLWDLKPALIAAAEHGCRCEPADAVCFTPFLDLGGMRHPALSTRLFIS